MWNLFSQELILLDEIREILDKLNYREMCKFAIREINSGKIKKNCDFRKSLYLKNFL